MGKTVVVAGAGATFAAMNPADFEAAIRASIATKQRLLESCVPQIAALCDRAIQCLAAGGKLLFCGNGGSSCDAAHAAGELVGWFENHDRPGYAAIALGHDVPTITAIANDISPSACPTSTGHGISTSMWWAAPIGGRTRRPCS